MLEAACNDSSVFLTLTYSDDFLPKDGSLSRRDLQLFFKRLRKAVIPRRIRYFAVGEYGDRTLRPHYHMALYGCSLLDEAIIAKAWSQGFIYLGSLTVQSADYICGYILKGYTKRGDLRLEGRYPEFSTMSLKPGIGAFAVPALSDAMTSLGGSVHVANTGDVTKVVRWDGKLRPLGRYLRTKLRESIGQESVGYPDALRESLDYYYNGGRERRNAERINAVHRSNFRLSVNRVRRYL